MKTEKYTVKEINTEYTEAILQLTRINNPNISQDILENRLAEMFKLNTYKCFGLFDGTLLIGISSCWSTVKFYSGLQLELDNFVIDENYRSKGLGKLLVDFINDWAKKNQYETVELNTYINNYRSHKFYFNQDFKIIGLHFQKNI
jgi:diamine N-acetyltransferase